MVTTLLIELGEGEVIHTIELDIKALIVDHSPTALSAIHVFDIFSDMIRK